jgi:RHS repeat-associated protein
MTSFTVCATSVRLSRSHFTGKERDTESGNDYFGARYYASSMGRFMSPDPMGGHLEDPQTLNRYVYVRNNPLSLTDPTGLDFYLQCTQTKGNRRVAHISNYDYTNGCPKSRL